MNKRFLLMLSLFVMMSLVPDACGAGAPRVTQSRWFTHFEAKS